VTSAIGPVMRASTEVDLSGSRSVPGSEDRISK
jgi:hypothetical protein